MTGRIVTVVSSGWRQLLFCFIPGLVLAFGQAPYSVPVGVVLSLPLLGWFLLRATNFWQAFRIGWGAGFGYFGLTLSWIVEPFLVDAQTFGWLAPFALFFMAAGAALFWGLAFAFVQKLGLRGANKLLALAIGWTLVEFARSVIFTGFPWGLLAYVWVETPIMQLASVIGSHGLGLLTLLVGFLPVMMPQRAWAGVVLAFALLGAGWGYGRWATPPVSEMPMTDTVVRLIQPNATQRLKWEPDMMPVFFQRQIGFTSAGSAQKPDVIIWPETAVPFVLGRNPEALQAMADAAGDAQLITGIRRREGPRVYNSMVQLDEVGGVLAVYDKQHLVPFGEYIPFASVLSRFGLRGLAAEDGGGFSAGPGPRIIRAGDIPAYLPLICYEAIFPQDVQVPGDRPEWLMQITNDAWFGENSGPYQHLAQTRVRAIEQGLPLARSANTGISAMIDPWGRILQALPLGEAGFVDATLPAARPVTLYATWRELPYFALSVLIAMIIAARRFADRRRDVIR
jgi:apolipoprotein N-acyltransferase